MEPEDEGDPNCSKKRRTDCSIDVDDHLRKENGFLRKKLIEMEATIKQLMDKFMPPSDRSKTETLIQEGNELMNAASDTSKHMQNIKSIIDSS